MKGDTLFFFFFFFFFLGGGLPFFLIGVHSEKKELVPLCDNIFFQEWNPFRKGDIARPVNVRH